MASLRTLRAEAAGCRACPLWQDATQTVFGAGSAAATVMLVGEQPGDQEDQRGLPFVGPAGRLLDEALQQAGVDRGAWIDSDLAEFVTATIHPSAILRAGDDRNREMAAFVNDLELVASVL